MQVCIKEPGWITLKFTPCIVTGRKHFKSIYSAEHLLMEPFYLCPSSFIHVLGLNLSKYSMSTQAKIAQFAKKSDCYIIIAGLLKFCIREKHSTKMKHESIAPICSH